MAYLRKEIGALADGNAEENATRMRTSVTWMAGREIVCSRHCLCNASAAREEGDTQGEAVWRTASWLRPTKDGNWRGFRKKWRAN